ncbi:trypsin-like peptidase domain-containing protein [Sulfitobacter sp. F26169L]|uniref:trypsin-like peptidase domain-containing protein n=1 Tax=Sulfitobacter sp. F26169L TaxID=2996015 RepID=UPI002260D305|nr:trypsin-like peptidase domain-containing protein [Sulfitobacter sp. F26169L]MCX7566838.1 trypsin-like peptidase domain-containing protein [Sulfitobacter sp. F26169L]
MRYLILILALFVTPASAQQIPQSAADIQLSFVPVVKQAAPAVVNIYAKIVREVRRTPLQSDPFFERFFRDPLADRKPRVQNSLGSGVILSEDGIVVSNYHVVGMATDIRVVLNDRREFTARVLLGDEESDLAILKIDAPDDLPFLELRASDSVEVGELALAIGNPFGVGQTVSSGIVSGLARSGGTAGRGHGYFIQTDAPINPGNSGGALVDMAGRLIGVNTSILTRSGGSNGIGFAIPADLVAAFVAQSQEGRNSFERPWAGISGQPLDADMAATLGFDRSGGIIISGLHPASPFLQAGLAVGDVILAVGGQSVNTPSEMVYRMSVAGLEAQAEVTFSRQGEERTAKVALIAAPEEPSRDKITLPERSLFPGLTLARINPAVLSELNLSLEVEGVAVMDVGPFAVRAGLRTGDVLMEINGETLAHPDDAAKLLSGSVRRIEMIVQRGVRRITMRFRG